MMDTLSCASGALRKQKRALIEIILYLTQPICAKIHLHNSVLFEETHTVYLSMYRYIVQKGPPIFTDQESAFCISKTNLR